MGNIITQNHGKVSAVDSQTLNEITSRLDSAESAITGAGGRITSLEGNVSSVSEQMARLQLLVAATNSSFGEFVPGYYNLRDNTSTISSVKTSTEWMCSTVTCEEGDKVYLNASGPAESGTYAFIDGNGLRIGDVQTGAVNNAEVTAPAGAHGILVNCSSGFANKHVSCGAYNEEFDGRIQDLITYQAEEPPATNKLWFKPSSPDRQVEIYTAAEVQAKIDALTDAIRNIDPDAIDPESGEPRPEFTAADKDKLERLGTAAYKNAVSSVVASNPSDANIATESALVNYVSGRINNLGAASSKGVVGSVDTSELLPTSSAVKTYVDNQVNGVKNSVVSTIDAQNPGTNIVNATAVHNYVQNAINNMDIPSPITQTITTAIPSSPDNTTIPTSKAVADHVSEAISAIEIEGIGGKGFDESTVSNSTSKIPSSGAVQAYVSTTTQPILNHLGYHDDDIEAINDSVDNLDEEIQSLENRLGTAAWIDSTEMITGDNDTVPTTPTVKRYVDAEVRAAKKHVNDIERETDMKVEAALGVRYAKFRSGYWAFNTQSSIDVNNPESSDSAKCACIACEAGDKIRFSAIGFENNGVYRIVKTDGEIVSGSEDLADNGVIVIPDDYTGEFYVAVNTTDDDTDAILYAGLVSTDIQDKVKEVENKADSAAFHIERIDRELSHDEIWQIQSSGAIIDNQWKLNEGWHLIFKVKSGDVASIIPHAINGTEYAFLSEYNPVEDHAPDYDENALATGLQLIEAGDEFVDNTAASDGYLYVSYYHSGKSVAPQRMLINGYDVASGVREKINKLSKGSLAMGGIHGSLGQTDWHINVSGVDFYKQGSTLEVSGQYNGESDLYVKITGTPRYAYGSYNFEMDPDYDTNPEPYGTELWSDHITGTCIQLQACCNGIPTNENCYIDDTGSSITYPEAFLLYDPVKFECYNYDCDYPTIASVTPVLTRSISYASAAVTGNSSYGTLNGDNSTKVLSSRICRGEKDGDSYFVRPQGIVMCIKPGTDFDTGVEGFEWPDYLRGHHLRYTVYIENMDDEYDMMGRIGNISTEVSTAQRTISRLSQQIQRTATGTTNGLMSAADKSKLDSFYGADMYVLKTDPTNTLKYKGTVAAMTDLPNDPENGDAYYVTAENGVYIYSGTTWDPFGPSINIESLSNAFIDNLFA